MAGEPFPDFQDPLDLEESPPIEEQELDERTRRYYELIGGGMNEVDAAKSIKAIEETLDLARTSKEDIDYCFVLARKLRKHVAPADRANSSPASRFLLACRVLLAELTDSQKRQYGDIDWTSDEELDELWYGKWRKIRSAEGENALEVAALEVNAELLPFGDASGRYLRILNFAYRLQQVAGKKSILLPVNEQFAALVGCSKIHLRNCIEKAKAEGLLSLVDGRYCAKTGRARKFRFLASPSVEDRP